MIKEHLLGLGLTSNEVEIYLVMLNHGELSVNEIGSKSGLHRQVCYDALDRLVEKGFISYITKNHKKFFKVLNPKKIIDYLDGKKLEIDLKKESITTIIPELNQIFQMQKEETDVEVVKGKQVLRTILNDIIKVLREKNETLYAMGIEETKFLEFDLIAIKQHISKLKKYNLKEKLLSKVSATHFFEGSQSEYRLIEDYMFNPNPTHIYGDKIAMVIWGHPTYGIIIKSKQLADANKKYFQMLWKIAKKK